MGTTARAVTALRPPPVLVELSCTVKSNTGILQHLYLAARLNLLLEMSQEELEMAVEMRIFLFLKKNNATGVNPSGEKLMM